MNRDYEKLLAHSCEVEGSRSPLEYLGDHIFDFTTYDSEVSELFASKAVEVCEAISNRSTFDYIKEPENYRWFLLMCNMPFFASKIEWGTSIRGAWWDHGIKFRSLGLWEGEKQLTNETVFTGDEWSKFMLAVSQFSKT